MTQSTEYSASLLIISWKELNPHLFVFHRPKSLTFLHDKMNSFVNASLVSGQRVTLVVEFSTSLCHSTTF